MISLDTNLLLYAVNSACAEHAKARAFLDQCAQRADVAIAELVLVELYVLLRNPAVVERPLAATEAADLCQHFRRHPRWALIENAEVMSEVWTRVADPQTGRRTIFDARLALTLVRSGVRELATRNRRDFESYGFDRVFDPLA